MKKELSYNLKFNCHLKVSSIFKDSRNSYWSFKESEIFHFYVIKVLSGYEEDFCTDIIIHHFHEI